MSAATLPARSTPEELNAKGAEFFREGHLEPARLHFLAALSLSPDQPQVLQNLGAVLRSLGHYEAAESVAKRSVALCPDSPFCLSNLGVSMLALRKYSDALEILRDVTRKMPESGPSWHNYGLALYMLGRYGPALAAFDKSLSTDYNNPQAKSDRALTLLSLERIQEGLEAYECRWEVLTKSKIWKTATPEWQGEPLRGRRILVHHEQGFGDSLMLVRFIKPLAIQGAIITLAVPPPLIALFKRSFPFVKVIDMEDPAIEEDTSFDYHTPLLSTMRWLGVEKAKDINAQPYLSGQPERALINLPMAEYRIGICWASGNHGPALVERRRVVPLTKFLPMSEIRGVSLVSLQVGRESQEISSHGLEGIIFDPSHKIEDFANTADIISRLDLVISVDSAVAHLAGAMGKPCIMLSPYTRCWRWWNESSGWPWYERMVVFSQSQNGLWSDALRLATKEVKRRVAEQNRDMG